jgi:rhodanese-related sulfurtransferase
MAESVKPKDARVDVASREVIVIDVRDEEDWNEFAERIPGSINVPPDRIEEKLEELPDDKTILIVSPDGERGEEVAERIEGREVRILEGGVEGWKSDQLMTQPSPDAAPPKGEDEEPVESPEDDEDSDDRQDDNPEQEESQ